MADRHHGETHAVGLAATILEELECDAASVEIVTGANGISEVRRRRARVHEVDDRRYPVPADVGPLLRRALGERSTT